MKFLSTSPFISLPICKFSVKNGPEAKLEHFESIFKGGGGRSLVKSPEQGRIFFNTLGEGKT